MRDYSKKYSAVVGSRQRVSGRNPRGPEQGGILKLVGVVAVVAMLVGVASSIWFGMALQAGLGKLDKSKQERQVLLTTNRLLSDEREALLRQEKIEMAAKVIGLYPPSEKQIRRP
ncbi:hypothetical protein ACUUL3_01455 [Thiovibrio sp. JS02]